MHSDPLPASHRMPEEIIAHIQSLAMPDGLPPEIDSTATSRDHHRLFSTVCRYWLQLNRAKAFECITIRSGPHLDRLLTLLSSPSPITPPLAQCIRFVVVEEAHHRRGAPWFHRVHSIFRYLRPDVKSAVISLRDLAGPIRSIHHDTPRFVPGTLSNFSKLALTRVEFRSVPDLLQSIRHLPGLSEVSCVDLTFTDPEISGASLANDHPPTRRKPAHGKYFIEVLRTKDVVPNQSFKEKPRHLDNNNFCYVLCDTLCPEIINAIPEQWRYFKQCVSWGILDFETKSCMANDPIELTIQPQEILYGSRRGGVYMSVYSSEEPDIALRWCLDSYDGDSHKRRHCESFEDALLQLEHNKDACLVLAINPEAADDEWAADEHRGKRAPRSHEDQRTSDHRINRTYFQDMSYHYRRFRDFKRSRNPVFHDGILWEPHGQDIYYDEAARLARLEAQIPSEPQYKIRPRETNKSRRT